MVASTMGIAMIDPTPHISVIVPTRNRSFLLDRLLESFTHVRYPDWDVLVVDDGSTDETAAVVERYRATGLHVRYERQQWGRMGSARNRGLALARGEISAFTDDDCTVTPEWLERIGSAFQVHPEALGVQGRTVTIREQMTPFTRQVEQLEGGQPYRTCNIAYRTSVLRELGGFDPLLIRGEDVVMGMRVLERGPIVFAPEMVVCHPPRPKEWADRKAWRTLLESETHFKRSYPRYSTGRSQTLSVQRANHVISRWLLLPIRRYWRWHWAYARRHPLNYLRQIPRIIVEKAALFSLMPYFLQRWRGAARTAGRGGETVHYEPIVPEQERQEGLLVTVVVPTRNRHLLLERLLTALSRQTYPHVEIIVVDDASTDGTAAVAEREGVRVVRQDTPAGSYAARNAGLQQARGEIIAFTDDDCIPQPGWVSALIQLFLATDVVGVQGVTLPVPGDITPFTHQIEQTRPGPPYRTCNIAYRRSILERLGGFDDRFRWYADNILGYRAAEIGKLEFAPDAVVYHPPRPRAWRTENDWRARFRADAAHRHELQALHVERKLISGRFLPLALWIARPIVKQLGAHLRYAARHPIRYARGIMPMVREKIAMVRALLRYWQEGQPGTAGTLIPDLPACARVSVIVVSRGRRTMEGTLAALAAQTRQPDEIVVVEHGARSLEELASRFTARYVHMPATAALGAVRQAGVDTATGDIITFTDDDCVPDPGWLAAAVQRFRNDRDAWGVQGRTDAESGPADTHAVRVRGPDPLYRTCNIAYRREALERAGGFDTGFRRWFEDTSLGARVTELGLVVYEPDMRVLHRAMPRVPMQVENWRMLFGDERRLERCYPGFYRTTRGPAFWPVIVGRWVVGSAVKTLLRTAPSLLCDPRSYVRLICILATERRAFIAATLTAHCPDGDTGVC